PKAEAVVIAVPTPLTRNREPDLGALVSSGTSLAVVLQEGQLIVLESTTYPGTTRERLVPLLEESGLAAGTGFNVAFSPERVDPGRTDYTLRNTPKVIGGLTPECLQRAVELDRPVCDEIVEVSTLEAAELTKLLENVFRSVNIAMVNELAMLCDRMGIDVWEVVEAAATKPYGFMRFDPGPGMGGHCLPVDPFYLAWKAREYDTPTEFIELAGEVNQNMPYFCVEKVSRALNEHAKPVRGSRVAVLGVSYKTGVGDLRESPAIKIMRLLRARGAALFASRKATKGGEVTFPSPSFASVDAPFARCRGVGRIPLVYRPLFDQPRERARFRRRVLQHWIETAVRPPFVAHSAGVRSP